MSKFLAMPLKYKLHIVSFAVPYPPDYGGVIDVFYKIKKLHSLGVSIVLHVFQYDGRQSAELEKYCDQVYYYPRSRQLSDQFAITPFIVKSRSDSAVLENLLGDDAPILFEGLHTTHFLNHPQLASRRRFIRMHNIESDYYYHLYKAERKWLKKIFFYIESKKLARYEKRILAKADGIFTVSQKDNVQLQQYSNAHMVGAFHSFEAVNIALGKGDFALYHGKLNVAENNEAALFLVNNVFSKTNYPLVVAGSDPSKELIEAVAKRENITLRTGLSTEEIHLLIAQAQMNVLPTFQSTGVKLKLLSALYSGRFCVVNETMVKGTGLSAYCHVVENDMGWLTAIDRLKMLEFGADELSKREQLEKESYSNSVNANKLYALLFPSS